MPRSRGLQRGGGTAVRPALACACLAAVICLSQARLVQSQSPAPAAVPQFDVDPSWPKPLPNRWVLGPVSGIALDANDHVLVVQRNESPSIAAANGVAAPPVVEFDPSGGLVRAWGGPGAGFTWMEQVHGISLDPSGRVWISGNGAKDSHLLVFSRTGALVRQIGTPGSRSGSDDRANVGAATQMRFDGGEVFVSDGEQDRNHRVIVLDAGTGAYRRHWGAYGGVPQDGPAAPFDPAAPPKQFGSAVHCLRVSQDGFVYVCDRSNNRFQVFRKDGTFVREVFLQKETRSVGSVWDVAFSPDQRFMYVADGTNQKVWILRRDTYDVVGSFGGPGRGPGQFATSLHDLMVDSHGNIFTGEAAAAGRIQKFTLRQGR